MPGEFDDVNFDAEVAQVQAERSNATIETGPEIDPATPQGAATLDGYIQNGKGFLHGVFDGARNFSNRAGEDLGAHWKIGEDVVITGQVGFKAFAGSVSKEDALAFQNRGEVQRLRLLTQMNKTGRELETKIGPLSLPVEEMLGVGAEMAPYMIHSMKEAGFGAAQGAATGAALLAPVGATVGGIFGGAPGAIVGAADAAGAGAAFGAPIGAKMGAINAVLQVETGNKYLELLNYGVDENTAKIGAVSYGLAAGAMELVGLQGLLKMGTATFNRVLMKETKDKLVPFLVEAGKNLGLEVLVEEAQEGASYLTDFILAEVSKASNPTAAGKLGEQVTFEKLKERLGETLRQSLMGMPVLLGGASVAGGVAGKTAQYSTAGVNAALRTAAQTARNTGLTEGENAPSGASITTEQAKTELGALVDTATKTLQAGIKIVQEGAASPEVTPEDIQQVRETPVGDLLDSLLLDASQPGPTDAQIAAAEGGPLPAFDTPGVKLAEQGRFAPDGDAPTLKWLAAPLQDTGKPGFGIEIPGRENTDRSIVYRDESGVARGVLHIVLDPDVATPAAEAAQLPLSQLRITNLEIAVDPEFRNKGIAKRLYEFAEENGFPVDESSGVEIFTKAGYALYKSRRAEKTGAAAESASSTVSVTAGPDILDPIIPEDLPGAPSIEVRGRIDQVKADIKTIDEKINTLERQMVSQAADGKATTATQNKIEKLYDDRTLADEELVDLVYGLTEKEDLTGLDIKVKADKILNLRAKHAKEVLKRFRQGVREGVTFTKQQVKQVQNQVVSLVRSAGLDLKDQAKFIQGVKNIQTPEQLDKALPDIRKRIDALLEATDMRAAKARLDKLSKQSQLRKTGKHPIGKFTADVQKVLNLYEQMRDADARAAAAVAFNDALASGNGLTDDVILANQIAQQMDPTGKKAADLHALADEIQAIMDTGRADALEKLMQRREEHQQRKAAFVESIQGDKPYSKKERGQSIIKELRDISRQFFKTGETWKGLMTLISQHDKNHAAAGILDPTTARENLFRMQDEWVKRISQKMAEASKRTQKILGKSVAQQLQDKFYADEHVPPKGQGDYLDADGHRQTLYLSRAEMRKLWMEFQAAKVDPVIRESFQVGNKYTFREDVTDPAEISTEQLLEEVLTAEDIALAEIQFQIYEDLYNAVLNPYWRERFGTDLPKAQMYSPLLREGFDIADDSTLLQHFVGTGGVKPSSTILRTGSTKPIAPQSDVAALSRHVEKVLRFVAYDEFDRNSKALLLDGEVRTLIQNKYGDAVYRLVTNHRTDIAIGQAIFQDIAWGIVDDLRRKTATAYIGGKLGSIPKQATAMFTALAEVGPVDFLQAVAEVTLRPVNTFKTLTQSATLRRILRSNDRDIVEVLKERQATKPGIGEGLIGIFLLPVRVGVGIGSAVSGKAVYNKTLRETGSQEQALDAMNAFLTDTQQSGFIEDQSAKERAGALGKALTMFGGDPLQSARQIIRSFRGVINRPTDRASWMKALRTYAVFHLAVPVMFQAMVNALNDDDEYDDERLLRAAIFGPWIQIPILGDALNYALVNVSNVLFEQQEKAFEPTSPLLATLVALGRFMRQEVKALTQEDEEAQVKALYQLGRATPLAPKAVGGGLPWPEILKWFQPEEDDDSGVGVPKI
jgi:GNAT superfamily N-acetyltransferase